MKEVISASRRTDLPRWYLKETISAFEKGNITLQNPFNKIAYTISLKPEDVHCIVWWSKNYCIWLAERERNPTFFAKYNHYFQFTLNGYSDPSVQKLLERGITTPLGERLEQLQQLVNHYTAKAINWRFDPITYWKDHDIIKNNTIDFETIAEMVGVLGIRRCTISFCDWSYKRAIKRASLRKLDFIAPSSEMMQSETIRLAKIAKNYGITLYSCANNIIVDQKYVFPSHCIDGAIINEIYGTDASNSKDNGQREACGCTKSRDIGSYNQKCKNGCTYCYANGI